MLRKITVDTGRVGRVNQKTDDGILSVLITNSNKSFT